MKFGLVGAGEIGTLRARALRGLDWAELAAFAEINSSRRSEIAARRFDDWREMLGEVELDAVIVSTPPAVHSSIVEGALAAGKHVLCEKPLAPTPEACRRLVEAARRNGRTLAVGFNQRYFPAVAYVKRGIAAGKIGRPTHARAYAGHRGLEELGRRWAFEPEALSCGAIMDNGVHLIDHVRYLLGDFADVRGIALPNGPIEGAGPSSAFALLSSADGRRASLEASWTEWRGYRFHIDVYGDEGMARAYYGPMFGMIVRGVAGGSGRRMKLFPATTVREKLRGWQSTVTRTFATELEDFRRMTLGEETNIAEGFDGFRAVEIAHATLESARSGKTVRLSEPF